MAQLTTLLTPSEVAERLGVSDETVHRWARQGKINSVRLPSGRKRFWASEVDAILANGDESESAA